jgi:hypothetical protein
MEILLNGKQACVSKALYGGPGCEGFTPDGKPWKAMSETTECLNIKVSKGDKLIIQASNDLVEHHA